MEGNKDMGRIHFDQMKYFRGLLIIFLVFMISVGCKGEETVEDIEEPNVDSEVMENDTEEPKDIEKSGEKISLDYKTEIVQIILNSIEDEPNTQKISVEQQGNEFMITATEKPVGDLELIIKPMSDSGLYKYRDSSWNLFVEADANHKETISADDFTEINDVYVLTYTITGGLESELSAGSYKWIDDNAKLETLTPIDSQVEDFTTFLDEKGIFSPYESLQINILPETLNNQVSIVDNIMKIDLTVDSLNKMATGNFEDFESLYVDGLFSMTKTGKTNWFEAALKSYVSKVIEAEDTIASESIYQMVHEVEGDLSWPLIHYLAKRYPGTRMIELYLLSIEGHSFDEILMNTFGYTQGDIIEDYYMMLLNGELGIVDLEAFTSGIYTFGSVTFPNEFNKTPEDMLDTHILDSTLYEHNKIEVAATPISFSQDLWDIRSNIHSISLEVTSDIPNYMIGIKEDDVTITSLSGEGLVIEEEWFQNMDAGWEYFILSIADEIDSSTDIQVSASIIPTLADVSIKWEDAGLEVETFTMSTQAKTFMTLFGESLLEGLILNDEQITVEDLEIIEGQRFDMNISIEMITITEGVLIFDQLDNLLGTNTIPFTYSDGHLVGGTSDATTIITIDGYTYYSDSGDLKLQVFMSVDYMDEMLIIQGNIEGNQP